MYRIIRAAQQQVLPASKQVNRVGKYLYDHIDGSYKYTKSGNTFDIWFIVYYQRELNAEVEEMKVNINVTTYQNKVRINTIEVTPNERTLGFDLFKPEDLMDLPVAYPKILKKIRNRIDKVYKDFIFIY